MPACRPRRRPDGVLCDLVGPATGGRYERRLLQQASPPYPDAGGDYATLLADTGWGALERIDITDEFSRCMGVLLRETRARRGALLRLLGEQDWTERLERRENTQAAVSRGLLKREIFLVQ